MKYPYYFYGSSDSIDSDVLISIPKSDMPDNQEDRKKLVKLLETDNWNTNLIVVGNGIIVDTIYPKTWVDSLNNALYHTYKNHLDKQKFPNPITHIVDRNILLSIYKTVRTVLSMLTRTHYRQDIKPILKGLHDFNYKIDALKKIDFTSIESFYQPNMKDIDVWKTIAFYISQNISLVRDGIEIYDKQSCVLYYPELHNFIYRLDIDKNILNKLLTEYISLIFSRQYNQTEYLLESNNEKIDTKNEIYI